MPSRAPTQPGCARPSRFDELDGESRTTPRRAPALHMSAAGLGSPASEPFVSGRTQRSYVRSTPMTDQPNARDRDRSGGRLPGRVFGRIVGTVVQAMPVDEVVERVDVDQIVNRVDVESVVDRIDMDALLQRIDVDALLARIDPNA